MVVTFIVSEDFETTAKALDNKRLGKQRLEARQILDKCEYLNIHGWDKEKYKGTKYASYVNQPVLLMWKDHTSALRLYYNAIVKEWMARGFENNMPLLAHKPRLVNGKYKRTIVMEGAPVPKVEMPPWLTWKPFLWSHMAALLRKNPKYYENSFPELPKNYLGLGYVWPTKVDPRYFKMTPEDIDPKEICGPTSTHRYCEAIIQSGDSAGDQCYAKIKDKGEITCRKHRKSKHLIQKKKE